MTRMVWRDGTGAVLVDGVTVAFWRRLASHRETWLGTLAAGEALLASLDAYDRDQPCSFHELCGADLRKEVTEVVASLRPLAELLEKAPTVAELDAAERAFL